MPTTITTRLVTAKDIKRGFQVKNLDLHQVLNLSWNIARPHYGQPLDYTFFTMKKGNKVIGGAVVEHLKEVESYYDPGVVIMKDLHYMLSDWTIINEYRGNGEGNAEQLIKRVVEVIKDPIGALTDYRYECDFYYLNGGNPLFSIEDLYEGGSYFLFNVDVETGKKLSMQFASTSEWRLSEINIDRLWKFNSQPHTLAMLNGWDSEDDEEDHEADLLESDIRNFTLDHDDKCSALFKCPKCAKRECTYMEIQTRSIDEAPKRVVTCVPCGHRWTHKYIKK